MRALDRKLWRDLWHLRGMVAAISLVLLGGISTFVMSRVTYESLATTQQRYYADQHFADLFVGLVRAPEALVGRQVAAVVNFPPMQIGPLMSEVLVLGFPDDAG